MGASGSAWIKPKKRSGLRPERLREVAHPRLVRPGQRYFPLASSAASRCPLRVMRMLPDGERCEARREDVDQRLVRCSIARLLTVDASGAGVHYRFVGYAPRTYDTHALVVDAGDAWVRLILPEWHQGLPVSVASGALPEALRVPQRWLRCRADLGALLPAKVMPRRFSEPHRAFLPELLPAPLLPADAERAIDRGRPDAGEWCGDVVLFVSGEQAAGLRDGARELYVTGHPPPLSRGARVRSRRHGGAGLAARRCRRPAPQRHEDPVLRRLATGAARRSHPATAAHRGALRWRARAAAMGLAILGAERRDRRVTRPHPHARRPVANRRSSDISPRVRTLVVRIRRARRSATRVASAWTTPDDARRCGGTGPSHDRRR